MVTKLSEPVIPRSSGITEMPFKHNGNILKALHPFYWAEDSSTLLKKINEAGYRVPTSGEVVSFAHQYHGQKGLKLWAVERDLTALCNGHHLRGFTGIIYLGKEQMVHFIDFPKFDERASEKISYVDGDNLLKRLHESKSQVPFSEFREGFVPWNEIAKKTLLYRLGGGRRGGRKTCRTCILPQR